MHLLMAEKTNQLLYKYQIKDFPIPIDIFMSSRACHRKKKESESA
jgi:hypothetical protein